jgi:hypothetical protein
MNHLESFRAAVKGKAPIVAIPVEGHAPVCVNRALIAKWSKGVIITRIEVVTNVYTTEEYKRPAYGHEGPMERVIVTHRPRHLTIEGRAGNVKTRCKLIPIDRRTAVKTLSEWSAKERTRLLKKTMLGALSPVEKRALKRAKHETEGEGMLSIAVPYKTPAGIVRRPTFGIPITIPQLPEAVFIVHRQVNADGTLADDAWAVSERVTGHAAGFGTTAEEAIIAARTNSAKASPERITMVRAQIAAESLAVAA